MSDIVSMGIALTDFYSSGVSENKHIKCEGAPGGSSANFAVAASRMGSRCAFLGMVGNDIFGKTLKSVLDNENINTQGMILSDKYPTSLAFVQLDENGDRSFLFYRNNTADAHFSEKNVSFQIIDKCKIIHIASYILVAETSRKTLFSVMDYAHEKNKLVSFDVNWRERSWTDRELGIKLVNMAIDKTDILKLSDEELFIFTGYDYKNWKKGAKILLDRGVKLVFLTLGSKGSAFYCKDGSGFVEACKVTAVDTTGAGDCCFGVFIHSLIENNININSPDLCQLKRALEYANTAAGYSVCRYGGILSLPYKKDVEKILTENPLKGEIDG